MSIEDKIKSALQSATGWCCSAPELNTEKWTQEICGALVDLGHELGHRVCACHGRADYREWLYDLVWYTSRGTGDDERLEDVPMVMECEWDTSTVRLREDFEKLLLANAPLKVYVCCPHVDTRDEWTRYFNDSIQGYHRRHQGDRFLIGFVREASKDIVFETIEVS